ncbi:hypothetical protein DOTSEDRAFT_70275 [Dothistroma septosporum NZE10]|uniref:Uncharacterized protein n=1 Tax=Dothistroma septosporum (strain NZE10 / CBS 128990) TaxID=675120 RepID=N1PTD4_DOTSN|nr:hypothetical protein DOTSEDRAFT_70275 [Dothistroma septosporum NZE10]
MHFQLFFPWLAIASAVTAQAISFADDSLEKREALASEDYAAQALYDDPGIDTSLEGYDHESVAKDLRNNRESKRAPLGVRDALASEALNMIHEYGQDVDVSLDGYDHDAVASDLEEGPLENVERGLEIEGAKKLGRMKPHYVVHDERDEDAAVEDDADADGDEEDNGPWVDLVRNLLALDLAVC